MPEFPYDLNARAHRAMIEAGFQPDFPPAVRSEADRLPELTPPNGATRDLRALLWSSIDNDSSRDLDQLEYAERLADGSVRLLIAIADVDEFVPRGSRTDQHAASETVSVYTGVKTFPMLPDELSADRTSLLPDQDRLGVVAELEVSAAGDTVCREFYRAWIRNRAKLTYHAIGDWLEGRTDAPAAIRLIPGLEAQLRLQQETSGRLRSLRQRHGALTFGSLEATAVVQNGEVKDLAWNPPNPAQDLIESFMVAANVAMAQFLEERGTPFIRRVVRTPKRWDRIQAIAAQFSVALPDTPDPRALSAFLQERRKADPTHFPDLSLSIVKLLGPGEYVVQAAGTEEEGHFGLAVQDYTHSTAPNRRYADLITQRIVKNLIDATPLLYTPVELTAVAAHCTEREDAARKVERIMRKVAAAALLQRRIGENFSAIVTGASQKGTYARLLEFPAEGRIVRGFEGIDVGDKVQVRLASVEIENGFIDLEKH